MAIYLKHISITMLILATSSAMADGVPAPGRGIIPAVSDHYKTQPSFYDFDQMPVQQITKNIGRRFIMGTESIMIRWDLKAGTKLPVHFHVQEQVTRVEQGAMEAYSQGQKYVMTPGQVMVFPPNVPHEFVALKNTVFIEQQTPARQDFINGDFEKLASAALTKK